MSFFLLFLIKNSIKAKLNTSEYLYRAKFAFLNIYIKEKGILCFRNKKKLKKIKQIKL